MSKSIILVDGSSIGHAAMQAAVKLSAGDVETTGVYGFLRTARFLKTTMEGRMVVLWDGRSWRYDHFAGYKASRDEKPELVEGRQRWKQQRGMVVRALQTLGIDQVRAGNLEADDLAARLTDVYRAQGKQVTLVSGDKDWFQLVGEGVDALDPIRDRHATVANFQAVMGVPSPFALAEYKAMMGDISDDIPGVGGVGDKTAKAILDRFGSVGNFVQQCTDDPVMLTEINPRLRLMLSADRLHAFEANMKLIWLRHPEAPKAENITATKGVLNPPAFRTLCEEWAFHSILRNFDDWLEPFIRKD